MPLATPLRHIQAACAVLSFAAFGAPVSAAPLVQLTLDTPNFSVFQPASGSMQYFFSGTIENLTGDTLSHSGSSLGTLQDTTGNTIPTVLEPIPFPTAPNSKVSGDLFSFTVDSTTPVGVYGSPGGGGALFTEQGFDTANSQLFDAQAFFTVTVNAPAAVPESSTTVSLGLLLALGLGGAFIAARKKNPA